MEYYCGAICSHKSVCEEKDSNEPRNLFDFLKDYCPDSIYKVSDGGSLMFHSLMLSYINKYLQSYTDYSNSGVRPYMVSKCH